MPGLRLSLTSQLVTQFHRGLATPEWLERLRDYVLSRLAEHAEYAQAVSGVAVVKSAYNLERLVERDTTCRYDFEVEADLRRPGWWPRYDRYRGYVTYDPRAKGFRLRDEELLTLERQKENRRHAQAVERFRRLIRQGADWEEVADFRCPWCGGPVAIRFHSQGWRFSVSCEPHPKHFLHHDIAALQPPWWKTKQVAQWIRER